MPGGMWRRDEGLEPLRRRCAASAPPAPERQLARPVGQSCHVWVTIPEMDLTDAPGLLLEWLRPDVGRTGPGGGWLGRVVVPIRTAHGVGMAEMVVPAEGLRRA